MSISYRRPWPFIKVCGIQSVKEGLSALRCGANTLGLLVGLTHKATDEVSVETAKLIAAAAHRVSPFVRVAMVTHLLEPNKVEEIARDIDADAIQIHDDMSVADVMHLRAALPNAELFKAVHIQAAGRDQTDAVIAYARSYAPYVDGFLTDSKSIDPDGQLRIGGTGKRHDPFVGQALVQAFPDKPVILAGGINGENAADAIREIGPAGIDANSGLENEDGSKNVAKMAAFAAAGVRCPLPPRSRICISTVAVLTSLSL